MLWTQLRVPAGAPPRTQSLCIDAAEGTTAGFFRLFAPAARGQRPKGLEGWEGKGVLEAPGVRWGRHRCVWGGGWPLLPTGRVNPTRNSGLARATRTIAPLCAHGGGGGPRLTVRR